MAEQTDYQAKDGAEEEKETNLDSTMTNGSLLTEGWEDGAENRRLAVPMTKFGKMQDWVTKSMRPGAESKKSQRPDEEEQTVYQKNAAMVANSLTYNGIIVSITIWAIFGDDLRVLSMPASADAGMKILNYIIGAIFTLDLGACWSWRPVNSLRLLT